MLVLRLIGFMEIAKQREKVVTRALSAEAAGVLGDHIISQPKASS